MRVGHFIRIAELGDFGMSKKEKNKREKEEKRMFYNRVLYDRQRNKRIYHNQKLREEWKAHCEKMISKGHKPWTYIHWKFIFKKRKIRKISEKILVLGSK